MPGVNQRLLNDERVAAMLLQAKDNAAKLNLAIAKRIEEEKDKANQEAALIRLKKEKAEDGSNNAQEIHDYQAYEGKQTATQSHVQDVYNKAFHETVDIYQAAFKEMDHENTKAIANLAASVKPAAKDEDVSTEEEIIQFLEAQAAKSKVAEPNDVVTVMQKKVATDTASTLAPKGINVYTNEDLLQAFFNARTHAMISILAAADKKVAERMTAISSTEGVAIDQVQMQKVGVFTALVKNLTDDRSPTISLFVPQAELDAQVQNLAAQARPFGNKPFSTQPGLGAGTVLSDEAKEELDLKLRK
jgi:hypothetical protein